MYDQYLYRQGKEYREMRLAEAAVEERVREAQGRAHARWLKGLAGIAGWLAALRRTSSRTTTAARAAQQA